MPSSGSWPATAATWCARTPTLRNQIHVELDALLPGLSAAVGDIFDHEPALVHRATPGLGRGDPRPRPRRAGGAAGCRARAVPAPRAWRRSWPGPSGPTSPPNARMFTRRIFAHLDDERRARLRSIRALEGDLAVAAGADALRAAPELPRDQRGLGRRVRRRDGADRQLAPRRRDHRPGRAVPVAVPERPGGPHRARWWAAPIAPCGT